MVVAERMLGVRIAGDVDVGPAVVVEVERGDAEAVVPGGLIEVGLGADVGEFSFAEIVVKNILRRRVARAGRTSRGLLSIRRKRARPAPGAVARSKST